MLERDRIAGWKCFIQFFVEALIFPFFFGGFGIRRPLGYFGRSTSIGQTSSWIHKSFSCAGSVRLFYTRNHTVGCHPDEPELRSASCATLNVQGLKLLCLMSAVGAPAHQSYNAHNL